MKLAVAKTAKRKGGGEKKERKRKISSGGRNVWTGFEGKMEKKKRGVRGGVDTEKRVK